MMHQIVSTVIHPSLIIGGVIDMQKRTGLQSFCQKKKLTLAMASTPTKK
jgi:hypothetical protein